jgi:hypothetical protein
MKKLVIVGALFVTSSAYALVAEPRGDFDVEASFSNPVPASVGKAIVQYDKLHGRKITDAQNQVCDQFVGSPLFLSEEVGEALAVTTADSCGWGNAVAPIWVVKDSKVILASEGGRLTLLPESNHSMPDIQASYSTMTDAGVERWVFNGKRYWRTYQDTFSLSDHEKCRTYQDVCPPIMNPNRTGRLRP